MQTCYNCGRQVPDETLICPDCGALVRRYTRPANPAVEPAARPDAPAFPAPAVQVPPKPDGRGRLHGPVKVWLIVLCAVSAYMAFSSLCCAFLAANPEILDAMLSQPGAELFSEMLTAMRDELPGFLIPFVLLFFLFVAKGACHLWLVLRARRLPFFVSIALSFAGLLCAILAGGSVFVIIYFLDPLVTWLGLRPYWPRMPK